MKAISELSKSPPMTDATEIPRAVPMVDESIDWEPLLAVISAKFSLIANVLCIAAREALKYKNFFFCVYTNYKIHKDSK